MTFQRTEDTFWTSAKIWRKNSTDMWEVILLLCVVCLLYRIILLNYQMPHAEIMKPVYLFDRVNGSIRYLGLMRPCDIIMRSSDRYDLFDYNDLIQFLKIYGVQT